MDVHSSVSEAELLLPTLPREYRAGASSSSAAASAPVAAASAAAEGEAASDEAEEGEIPEEAPPTGFGAGMRAAAGSGHSPGRLELVLDLDHTLVHSAVLTSAGERDSRPPPGVHTFSLWHPNPQGGAGVWSMYKLRVREGLQAFLREVLSFCTVRECYCASV